ncbi:MAG: A24 family peptidase [Candidatus Caenarcaniphilales bacterium]|nr:A24 family peptidase [Candidatus Caenarcaniphilales bacterium]
MSFYEQNNIGFCFLTIALAFSLGAAYFDLKTRKIPNRYNLSFFLFGLIIKLALIGISSQYLINGLIGSFIGFLIFLPFFILRLAGGGDVKLLATLGMLLGWQHFLWVFVITSTIDGLILIPGRLMKTVWVVLNLPGSMKEKLKNLSELNKGSKRNNKNPYALPVALGCLVYLLVYLFFNDYLRFS